jgi:hypothetical protein
MCSIFLGCSFQLALKGYTVRLIGGGVFFVFLSLSALSHVTLAAKDITESTGSRLLSPANAAKSAVPAAWSYISQCWAPFDVIWILQSNIAVLLFFLEPKIQTKLLVAREDM